MAQSESWYDVRKHPVQTFAPLMYRSSIYCVQRESALRQDAGGATQQMPRSHRALLLKTLGLAA
jgi:hypothetical protein